MLQRWFSSKINFLKIKQILGDYNEREINENLVNPYNKTAEMRTSQYDQNSKLGKVKDASNFDFKLWAIPNFIDSESKTYKIVFGWYGAKLNTHEMNRNYRKT